MAPEARSERAEISMRVMPTVCPMEVTACRRRAVICGAVTWNQTSPFLKEHSGVVGGAC